MIRQAIGVSGGTFASRGLTGTSGRFVERTVTGRTCRDIRPPRTSNITGTIAALAAVSAKASPPPVVSEKLRKPLAELSSSHTEFQEFFSSVCEELETLAADLVRRQKSWQTEQAERQAELQRRAARLEDERSEVASQWERVQVQAEQNRSSAAVIDGESGAQVQDMLKEAERERAALHSALEVAQSQSTQLAEVVGELSRTRSELTVVRQEIKDYPEQFGAASADGAKSPQVAELEEELHRLKQEQVELNQERAVLETELEAVRNRAAELSETIERERQQMSDERSEWTAEMKRMRRTLETFAQRQIELAETGGTGQVQEPAPDVQNQSNESANDPVLDSVMAQFEMLQKDLAKRRKSSAKSGT